MMKQTREFAAIFAITLLGAVLLFVSGRPQVQFAAQVSMRPSGAKRVNILEKPATPGAMLQFEVVSDIHVQAEDKLTQERFRLVLNDLAQDLPGRTDALIVNGDLGDGKPEDYSTLQGIVTTARKKVDYPPILFNIGNHEFYKAFHDPFTQSWKPKSFPNGETDAKAVDRYLAFTGEEHVYYERVIGGYHLLFLGSEKSRMSDPNLGDAADLSQRQLDWLKDKLKEGYSPDKPMFIFLHQPLFTASGWGKTRFVMQQDELRELFQAYPGIIVFSGHLHTQLGLPNTFLEDGYTLFNDSSPARTRDINFQIATDKSEGLVIQVFNDEVLVKGRDFLHRRFVPGIEYTIKNSSFNIPVSPR